MDSRDDLDINEFETILKAEKAKIEKNIEVVKAEIEALVLEDEITDDLDMAEIQIDNDVDQKILKQLEAEVAEINAALSHIKAGTYGICEKTGQHIPIERLKANPMARIIIVE